jgi:hypothetical protein
MKVLELYSGIGGMHFAFKGVYGLIAHTYMYLICKAWMNFPQNPNLTFVQETTIYFVNYL